MDLKQIEYIVKIAEEKNITRAAEKLFLTQPALNKQLLKLEKELGVPLFHRVKNAWELTYAGEVYVENARSILNIKNETYKIINDIANVKKGRLSVGFIPERGSTMFSHVYPEFYRMYPKITVEPTEARALQLESLISKGALDIAFITLPSNEIPVNPIIPISKEELVLAVPINHKLSHLATPLEDKLTCIDLSLFKDDVFVLTSRETTSRCRIDAFFDEAGFFPNILLEVSNSSAIIDMVSNGICCSIMPRYYAKNDGRTVYFSLETEPSWELAASYKKDSYLNQASLDFIELAKLYWCNNKYYFNK